MAKMKKRPHTGKKRNDAMHQTDFIAEIQLSLTHKRSQKALIQVKNALKSGVVIDDTLAGQVYLLRLKELIKQGQINAAKQFHLLRLDNSGYWSSLPFSDQCMIYFQMGLSGYWVDYGQNAEHDRVIDQLILTEIHDLRPFVQQMNLPDTHFLRGQAQAVLDAWALIDAGNLDDVAAILNLIGRRSPFRGWRLFLQALMGYYQHDLSAITQNLSRMPENVAIQPLCDRLNRLLNRKRPAASERSPVFTFLLKDNERFELQSLEQQLATKPNKTAVNRIMKICKGLTASNQSQLACEISSLSEELPYNSESLSHLVDLRQANWDGDADERRWELETIFHELTSAKTPPALDDIDYAVLLTKIAQIWYEIHARSGADFERCGSQSGWVPCQHEELEGLCPGCIVKQSLDLCQKAIHYYPLEKTYQLAVKILAFDPDPTGAEPLLQSWLSQFPDSIAALRSASQRYVDMQNWKLAEQCIDRLREVSGNSHVSQDAYRYFAIYQSFSLCKSGGNILPRINALFESIVDDQDERSLILQSVIRWIAARTDKKQKERYIDILTAYNRPYLVFYFCQCVLPGFSKRELPKSILNQLNDCELLFGDLPILNSLKESLWRFSPDFDGLLKSVVPGRLIKQIEGSPELFFRLLLFYLGLDSQRVNFPDNAYKTIARHLADGQPHQAEFWALRGLFYNQECIDSSELMRMPEEVKECFTLAFYYDLDNEVIKDRFETLVHISDEEITEHLKTLTPQRIKEITSQESRRTRAKDLEAVLESVRYDQDSPEFETLIKARMLKVWCEIAGVKLDEDLTDQQLFRIHHLLLLSMKGEIDEIPEDLANTIGETVLRLNKKNIDMNSGSDQSLLVNSFLEIIIPYVKRHGAIE